MHITLLEPFFTGSHRSWAEGLQHYSRHHVELLTMKGNFWKWRMHGGSVTLARQFLKRDTPTPDLILSSEMLDLSVFCALTRLGEQTTRSVYFHENQITYPWSPTDPDTKNQRDQHYGFINFTSALCADRVLFNSAYHRDSFLGALPAFLRRFPDYQEVETVEEVMQKSTVLPLGMDLLRLAQFRHNDRSGPPVILWNHRWEYDKNPHTFFEALFRLQENAIDFKVVVLGQGFRSVPSVFEEARQRLHDHILHWGYAASPAAYAYWLWKADILPVTAIQDFFGGSTVEAIYCNCYPVLPRRLAYGEHIPPAAYSSHFYDDPQDLSFFLEHLILNIDNIRKQEFQHFVTKYDWRKLITHYDGLFEQLQREG